LLLKIRQSIRLPPMIPANKKILVGHIGEDAAVTFLRKHSYTILHRNTGGRYGEIDIVARDGKTLVFVEVKTRTSEAYGTPQDAITPHKVNTLKRSVDYFCLLHPNLKYANLRIDVIAVFLDSDSKVTDIKHFRSITA
jgi:putative endonuclease